ncbi:hypothetical protein [Nocardiopsis dassonvillei]|uniref:hypothetical protein n=1 Tax=Nocardiopsis dassonvillei TaxID=2014 RepID=UPI003F55100E
MILIGAGGCAVLAGALRLAAEASWPEALLVAGAALGAAVGLLATLVKEEALPEDEDHRGRQR